MPESVLLWCWRLSSRFQRPPKITNEEASTSARETAEQQIREPSVVAVNLNRQSVDLSETNTDYQSIASTSRCTSFVVRGSSYDADVEAYHPHNLHPIATTGQTSSHSLSGVRGVGEEDWGSLEKEEEEESSTSSKEATTVFREDSEREISAALSCNKDKEREKDSSQRLRRPSLLRRSLLLTRRSSSSSSDQQLPSQAVTRFTEERDSSQEEVRYVNVAELARRYSNDLKDLSLSDEEDSGVGEGDTEEGIVDELSERLTTSKQEATGSKVRRKSHKKESAEVGGVAECGGHTSEEKPVGKPGVYESIITLDPFEMISMAHQVHIVANPMQDPLYSTIGEVSERVYECPDTPPPPVPPKQMEVLYTKPTKKSNGGAAFKIYKSREHVPLSPTRDSSSSSSSHHDREMAQENMQLKQEVLAYRERVKALASKLEQFDSISHIVEDLQAKVEKVSQENSRLRHYETEHRDLSEQIKEAQLQYKLDVDQLSSQVAMLDNERCVLEQQLSKLQQEHECLLISTQNSVSFQYHSQSMLEVKRLLEELKNKYQNDREALLLKAETAEAEKSNLMCKITQLEEELASVRNERDVLNVSYRKAVRQNQTLISHIKELENEDTEIHALMQTLLQSAHQAVTERDTLERMVTQPNTQSPPPQTPQVNGVSTPHHQSQLSPKNHSHSSNTPPPSTQSQLSLATQSNCAQQSMSSVTVQQIQHNGQIWITSKPAQSGGSQSSNSCEANAGQSYLSC